MNMDRQESGKRFKVKWGAPSRWSSFLYNPTQNSDAPF